MFLQGMATAQLADEALDLLHITLDPCGLGPFNKADVMVHAEKCVYLSHDAASIIRARVGLQVIERAQHCAMGEDSICSGGLRLIGGCVEQYKVGSHFFADMYVVVTVNVLRGDGETIERNGVPGVGGCKTVRLGAITSPLSPMRYFWHLGHSATSV